MVTTSFDRIIIGAGIYGLYAALSSVKQGYTVVIIECDPEPFSRASYINQARVHFGYHYPRSISTAMKSASYFERFNKDYSFCINGDFEQIYATSKQFSWTDGKHFKDFCDAAGIPCEPLHPSRYFKDGLCDGVFKTREYTYDAIILKEYLLDELSKYSKQFQLKKG
ncbi:MAG: FAD-binding oxidoreductase, partial [Saccharofermentans sp.]|nr:FAD-binding oxidoreductase [Saccharofermentans sp.]